MNPGGGLLAVWESSTGDVRDALLDQLGSHRGRVTDGVVGEADEPLESGDPVESGDPHEAGDLDKGVRADSDGRALTTPRGADPGAGRGDSGSRGASSGARASPAIRTRRTSRTTWSARTAAAGRSPPHAGPTPALVVGIRAPGAGAGRTDGVGALRGAKPRRWSWGFGRRAAVLSAGELGGRHTQSRPWRWVWGLGLQEQGGGAGGRGAFVWERRGVLGEGDRSAGAERHNQSQPFVRPS